MWTFSLSSRAPAFSRVRAFCVTSMFRHSPANVEPAPFVTSMFRPRVAHDYEKHTAGRVGLAFFD